MDISELRGKINAVDEQLLPLFLERMKLSAGIAGEKKKQGLPVYDPAREREILARIGSLAGDMDDYAQVLYMTLFDLSRAYQGGLLADENAFEFPTLSSESFPEKAVVACQGIEGAYSQQAADRVFRFADIMYMKSFEGVFQAVEAGLCRFGILPVENSAHGTVHQVYDLMRTHHFSIVRAVKLHIRHCLLVKSGTGLQQIKTIVSHEQALGQCSDFLSGLKQVNIISCENTAVAAKMVADCADGSMAAIASETSAEIYGLSVLNDRIQNTDNNYTRFIVIEKEPTIYPGAEKISLMFSLPHTPGSLSRLMSRFAALSLNLTKLESRPVEGSNFHYVFYADLEAAVTSPPVRRLLSSMSSEMKQFAFLGAYQEV